LPRRYIYFLLFIACSEKLTTLQRSLLEQAKIAALATGDAVAEGAKLAKDLAAATYEAGKELVFQSAKLVGVFC
jgi:hypothetical protein